MSKPSVTRITCARIPTEYGNFHLCYYTNTRDKKEHLAFYMGDVNGASNVLVRVHSECFTGDVLGSMRCDCGEQLNRSLQLIASEGAGVVVYLRQEGRGIGLLQKLRAYNLQDQGHDTVDANLLLGHEADERDYSLAARILEDLGVRSARVMTNNPGKISALETEGITVSARVPLEGAVTPENERYLHTKAQRMDHLLQFKPFPSAINGNKPHDPQPAD
ncbi:MAG: GTP cyclohydrolase II [Pseudomonadales bacterium]|nr:GTP cyclohydrolase II [Pseudomonadales bacterium]